MENQLNHLVEFQAILSRYEISAHGKKIMDGLPFIVLSGLSSSGRNTLIRELIKTNKYHFIISDTTRLPRVNDGIAEKNGVEYWFKTEEQMLQALKAGEMLEAEIIHDQQVSGISIAELQRAKLEDKIAITDMEIGGFESVLQQKADIIAIVLLPPSFSEWQNRMDNRGKMPITEKIRRLETAMKVINTGLGLHKAYFVVNHDFHQTVKVFNNIQNQKPDQDQAHKVALELLEDTRKYLRKHYIKTEQASA